ncbi:hypothetical protein [Desulfovibrio litoralis]|nr:hypothetical protein [Desulfovibrio litoralis]
MDLSGNVAFLIFLLCGFFAIFTMFFFIWRNLESLALSIKEEKRLFLSNLVELEEKIQDIKIQLNNMDLNSGQVKKEVNHFSVKDVPAFTQEPVSTKDPVQLEPIKSYEPITASVRRNTSKQTLAEQLNKKDVLRASVVGSPIGSGLVDDVFLALNSPVASLNSKISSNVQPSLMMLKD